MLPVTPIIVCFRANNPSPMTLDGTNCYIVSDGRTNAMLIDVGPAEQSHIDAMASYLHENNLRLHGILLTHTHHDHIDGLASFQRLVDAPVHAFKPGYDQPLHDGERMSIGDDTLQVIYTPGHSGDCVCFFHERKAVLFTGDTMLGVGTSVISPPEGDVSDYLDSLERLKSFTPKMIAPGHGPLITDPRAKIDEYIEHRLMRERQIMAQLQTGPKTVPELVEEIYKDVDKQLHGAAAWSVSAHLKRLERAGKVSGQGERFRWLGG